jgi:hypothetical protein
VGPDDAMMAVGPEGDARVSRLEIDLELKTTYATPNDQTSPCSKSLVTESRMSVSKSGCHTERDGTRVIVKRYANAAHDTG